MYSLSGSPTMTNCILWNPGSEISVDDGFPEVSYCCVQGGYTGTENIDAYPQFVDPANGDWRLEDQSPFVDAGMDVGLPFNGANPDMGAWESPGTYTPGPRQHVSLVLRVDTAAAAGGDGLTWATAFQTLEEALRVCSASDEIWVAGGKYNESIHMEQGLAVFAGFASTESLRDQRDWQANTTILDATGLNGRAIIVDDVENTTIDGFTVTGGNTTSGAGIYFGSVVSATLTNCTISGNTANFDGGGMDCYDSSPTLTNCAIIGNTAGSYGGGVQCFYSSPSLTNCTITSNSAYTGGGVYCYESSRR